LEAFLWCLIEPTHPPCIAKPPSPKHKCQNKKRHVENRSKTPSQNPQRRAPKPATLDLHRPTSSPARLTHLTLARRQVPHLQSVIATPSYAPQPRPTSRIGRISQHQTDPNPRPHAFLPRITTRTRTPTQTHKHKHKHKHKQHGKRVRRALPPPRCTIHRRQERTGQDRTRRLTIRQLGPIHRVRGSRHLLRRSVVPCAQGRESDVSWPSLFHQAQGSKGTGIEMKMGWKTGI
jgi:hypothetical protein